MPSKIDCGVYHPLVVVVGEPEAEGPVEVQFVLGFGFAERYYHVSQLFQNRGDLVDSKRACKILFRFGPFHAFEGIVSFGLRFGDPSGDESGIRGACGVTAAVIEVDRVRAALRVFAAAVAGLADSMVPEGVTRPSAELTVMAEPEAMGAEFDAATLDGARPSGPMLGPAELWHSTRMCLALGRHDWTTVFRLLQRHGISQRKIAAACQCFAVGGE